MSTIYAGVDVGKDELVMSLENSTTKWKNTPARRAGLIKRLRQMPLVQVVCEASGGYESPLVDACHAAGIAVAVVPPQRVRHFAQAYGQYAKNDAIDAVMIARYATQMQPVPDMPISAACKELREWVTHRASLVDELVRKRRQIEGLTIPNLIKAARRSLAAMQKELDEADSQIAKLTAKEDFAPQVEAMTAMPGVGTLTAATMLALVPELGKVNRRQLAKLIGLAPFDCDSGKSKGKRHIRGGRHRVRKALYMPAIAAIRHNPALKEDYERLVAKGKPKKVAITAIMRKLLVTLNAIMKQHFIENAA